MTKITVVGLGLIGGSVALDLSSQLNVTVTGVDNNIAHTYQALELGLVDKIESLEKSLNDTEVVILAIPVDHIEKQLPSILDNINDKTIVIDLGSTKDKICQSVADHPRRGRYIAAHPLAGTEFSGPGAATKGLFRNKKNIICQSDLSDNDALELAIKVMNSLGMHNIYMTSEEHDKHLAYVSHLSHISSFVLGLTVLDIEKSDERIFDLASTGFESTARLAKSNPSTWTPILTKNKKHLISAIDKYSHYLSAFRSALADDDQEKVKALIMRANNIKRVLKK